MDPLIRKALTWTMLGLGVMLFCFCGLDLASGARELSIWMSLVGWAAVVGICWAILAKGANKTAAGPSNGTGSGSGAGQR